MVKMGTWVRIHRILLAPADRAENLPEDTRKVPFELWVKGFLTADAEIGEAVEIRTVTGRTEHGTLETVEPSYRHDFGVFVPELQEIDRIVLSTLYGERR
ncbi:MAG TPA: 2-amino-4-ketopentanoate thiolase [Acholeplasmatales bacterium]|nr:2-amino-4-oxopentanoate thiolase subunit OrtA [Bacillota bacterium]OHE40787.1 MAG: 2-amino-4-ketopentanoate thiolase [Tenericutes bacterium GWF2_57_13]HAQ56279.1 2-amino-4-ketopentanoate thiolase [Acholeplasmatales bacterium]